MTIFAKLPEPRRYRSHAASRCSATEAEVVAGGAPRRSGAPPPQRSGPYRLARLEATMRLAVMPLLLLLIAVPAAAQVECRFTDNPIVAGQTPIRARHINELRNCLDLVLDALNQQVPPRPSGGRCEEDLGMVTGVVTRNGSWDGSCPEGGGSSHFGRVYRFTLSQPAAVKIELTSPVQSTTLTLYRGTEVGSNQVVGTLDSIERELDAGPYTLEVGSWGETGSYTLTLDVAGRGPQHTACQNDIGTLVSGVPLSFSGSWDGSCRSAQSPGRSARYYSFALQQPAAVTIVLTSPDAVDASVSPERSRARRRSDPRGRAVRLHLDGGVGP